MRTLLILLAIASVSLTNPASAQNINGWTPKSLKEHFGAATASYVGGRIKTIVFSEGPSGNFHGDQCFDLILAILRGPGGSQNYDNVDDGEFEKVDHETGCLIRQEVLENQLATWRFTVTKNRTPILTAEMIEWRSGGPHGGPQLTLHIK